MPGLRGRSKGCLTCRRRKVKCDQGRPACERCKNGYFHCDGYQRPLIFRNTSMSAIRGPHDTEATGPAEKALATDGSESRGGRISANLPEFENQVQMVPRFLHLRAFQENLTISHLSRKMFWEYADSSTSSQKEPPWIVYVANNRDSHSTQYLSLLALASSFFGRVHRDELSINRGAGFYGRALRNLVVDLNVREKARQEVKIFSLLSSSLCLGMYELVTGTDMRGWFQHSGGTAAIIESFGPEAFQKSPAHIIFRASRSLITIRAILDRKHSFLEQPRWKTVPWALEPQSKTLDCYLQDIQCDVPGFYEDCLAILTRSVKGRDALRPKRTLRGKVLATLQQLYNIRWGWEQTYGRSCREVAPDPSESLCMDENGKPLFETVLQLTDLRRIAEVTTFDSLLLTIHNILHLISACPLGELYPPSGIPHPKEDTVSASSLILPGHGNCEDVAVEICRLVDYGMLGKQDSLGAFILLFPLRVAYEALHYRRPRIARWIERILKQIASTKGFEVGEHILLQPSIPLKAYLPDSEMTKNISEEFCGAYSRI